MRGSQGPALTLAALRAKGYEVKVEHWRHYENDEGSTFFGHERNAANFGFEPRDLQPRGGATLVSIWHPEQEIGGVGSANCAKADNFDRRLGLRMALGRALADLQNNQEERMQP